MLWLDIEHMTTIHITMVRGYNCDEKQRLSITPLVTMDHQPWWNISLNCSDIFFFSSACILIVLFKKMNLLELNQQ